MKNNLNLILIIFFSIYLIYDFKRKRNISKKIENFPPPRRPMPRGPMARPPPRGPTLKTIPTKLKN